MRRAQLFLCPESLHTRPETADGFSPLRQKNSKSLLKNGRACVIMILYRGCRIFRLQGACTPEQAVALVSLQPPAVFFIHREQRKPVLPHGGFFVSRCCGQPLPLDMAFPPFFPFSLFFARKKTARSRRVRRRTEKIHDEKAYFRKPPCQNRENVI